MKVAHLVQIARELRSLPKVEAQLWGSHEAKQAYVSFTSPHPRYRLIQSKQWGVGLLELPGSNEEYLDGPAKSYLRRKRRRAASRGFRFGTFAPTERIGEIMCINRSAEYRQGKPMASDYLDINNLRDYYADKPELYGVFDMTGAVRAYAYVPLLGDISLLARLLGHADDLDDGIMYLLVSEVIREMISRKLEKGAPRWVMYDTFFGAAQGLRLFKEHLGFRPHKVRWVWSPELTVV